MTAEVMQRISNDVVEWPVRPRFISICCSIESAS
jgi:hypothetical protein